VAEFVGLTNRIDGTAGGGVVNVLGTPVPLLEGSVESGPVKALVRPENVRLTRADDGVARVAAVSFLGSLCRAQVTMPDESLVVARCRPPMPTTSPRTASARAVPAPVSRWD
jgi:putative spermidine/putrescine transport system ATP-binding protein